MKTEPLGLAVAAAVLYLMLRPKAAQAGEPANRAGPPVSGATPPIRPAARVPWAPRGPRPSGAERCRPNEGPGPHPEVCRICPNGGWWVRRGDQWVCA